MHLWITEILVLVLLLTSPLFYTRHHPVKDTDLEIQAQQLWKPYGVMAQVMDFETPQLLTTH